MNISNTPDEEKNLLSLSNVYIVGKFNILSQIKSKKNKTLDYVSKLISKNGQRNSEALKPTGNVEEKYNNILK